MIDHFVLSNGDIEQYDYNGLVNKPESDAQPLSDKAINAVLKTANSYIDKNNVLSYGHNTATHRVSPTADPSETQEIDCSTMLELILQGVPYEASRYCGHASNKVGYNGYSFNVYGNDIDSMSADMPPYTLTYQFAERLKNVGYGFYPNDDLSNVRQGDILFFATAGRGAYPDRFLDIDHCEFLIDRQIKGSNDVFTVLGAQDNRTGVCQVSYAYNTQADALMRKLVYCARVPINETNTVNKAVTTSPNSYYFANVSFSQGAHKLITVTFKGIINTLDRHFTVYVNDTAHTTTKDILTDEIGVEKFYKILVCSASSVTSVRLASADTSAVISDVIIEDGYNITSNSQIDIDAKTHLINRRVTLTTDDYGSIDFNFIRNEIPSITNWEQVIGLYASGYLINRESVGSWRVYSLSGNTPSITRQVSTSITCNVIYRTGY